MTKSTEFYQGIQRIRQRIQTGWIVDGRVHKKPQMGIRGFIPRQKLVKTLLYKIEKSRVDNITELGWGV